MGLVIGDDDDKIISPLVFLSDVIHKPRREKPFGPANMMETVCASHRRRQKEPWWHDLPR